MRSSIWRFIFKNRNKKQTIYIYACTAYYRFMMLHLSSEKLEKRIGIRGEESADVESMEHMRLAYHLGKEVCRIADKTLWESKCLVKALTARRLLAKHGIESTLYLGVGKEDGKMVAHAWLRCGEMYVTGGNGEGYATVAKFHCK